jgi:dTDP_gluc_dehyt: dTDP-glucose 4,6-dehydratase
MEMEKMSETGYM